MIKAFPKIFAVGTDYISPIFEDEVEVTEKIDGSQFCFGKINGELFMRSKGTQQYAENPDKMFKEAVDYVVSIEEKIPDNTVLYCEYLKNPKHNVLSYSRIPRNHLICFGVADSTESFKKNYKDIAEKLGIETVPVLYIGKVNSPQELLDFLEKESVLGGPKMEGVVVKNYNKPFLLGGQPIPLMCGKYVSEAFKEVHRERWGEENTARGKFQLFKESFRTDARWEKSIQHLAEAGQLENSPRDIGKLLGEVKKDIEEEEKENIKNYLYKEFIGEVLRTATAGLPEWYKRRLLEKGFSNEKKES